MGSWEQGIRDMSLFLSVVVLRGKVKVQLCPKSEPTLCCVTLVGFGVSGFAASPAATGRPGEPVHAHANR